MLNLCFFLMIMIGVPAIIFYGFNWTTALTTFMIVVVVGLISAIGFLGSLLQITEATMNSNQRDNEKLRRINGDYENQIRHLRAWIYALEHKTPVKSKQSTSVSTFTKQEIKTLIALCHPDKHGNSKTSNDITKRLLELRK